MHSPDLCPALVKDARASTTTSASAATATSSPKAAQTVQELLLLTMYLTSPYSRGDPCGRPGSPSLAHPSSLPHPSSLARPLLSSAHPSSLPHPLLSPAMTRFPPTALFLIARFARHNASASAFHAVGTHTNNHRRPACVSLSAH